MILFSIFHFGDEYGVNSGWDWTRIALVVVSVASAIISYFSFKVNKSLQKNSDAKKLFVKIQVEAIIKMLTELRKHTICITHKYETGKARETLYIKVPEIKEFLKEGNYLVQIFENVSIVVEYSLLESLTFLQVRKDIYLPPVIAKELELFYSGIDLKSIAKIPNLGNANYIHRDTTYHGESNQQSITNHFAIGKPYNRSIKTYLEHFLHIQRISMAWLEAYDINLNIDDI